MEINKAIKENRILKNLTQKDLGDILNVSDKTISSWETGRTYPDVSMIIKLAETFDLSLDTFLKGDDEMIKKIDKDLRFKNIYKYLLLFIGLSIITLTLFLYIYQDRNAMVDRFNPLMEYKIGYAVLPKEVTYNDGKKYNSTRKKKQYPDQYKNIVVLDSPFGDTSVLDFYGGKPPEGRNYAIVKHKGQYVEKMAFIKWEAIPELYRQNMEKDFIGIPY
ncbi:helix-turn-helix domain-containing protein [Macrococcoides goetzii]|uniref:helix-turn-helix domain-containing protein n=1 Tax=Macrococcus TaxID=69965 RepID=UPI00105E83D1|nr:MULTISPECIES: helix-turn-helix transcriptional regulator [Macrococcus]MCG7419171.1 helix-turn-helix domain-containing protein [Macrococcus epidermidis]MCH4985804.1 helix-turn-helix transcriptional regulator [Macrococcus sp. PK]TDM45615.1 XRE family transcriptional regulator [Macrococcus goetzii]UTH16335.1 helix-turn-helix transcriptional regulator [Macrococcus epidermidis]